MSRPTATKPSAPDSPRLVCQPPRRVASTLHRMSPRQERLAAALEAAAHALLELAALEREPEEGAQGVRDPPSVLPAEPCVRARGQRTPDRQLPAGMTPWVSAAHVACAVACSNAKAHEYLRAAARRSVGTGQLLRVPVDVWEAWARENLNDRLGRECRGTGRASRRAVAAEAASTAPRQYRRPDLSLFPRAESKLPLIPTLVPAKRSPMIPAPQVTARASKAGASCAPFARG